MQPGKKTDGWKIIGIIVLVLAIAGYGMFKYVKKDESVTNTPVTTTTGDVTGTVPALEGGSQPNNTMYADGSYSAIGNYYSPGGAEEIKVDLTLKDGTVTSLVATSLATRPESKMWQGKFVGGISSVVVGKKLDEVSVTKVSGSSLTPKGFMDALTKIKAEAQAAV